ncbi:MAG: hypothetical protein ACREQI_12065 [Candidatus Binataceae bacterium]
MEFGEEETYRAMMIGLQRKREIAWVALGSVAFALCFTYQLAGHLTQGNIPGFVHYGGNDWDPFLQLEWVAYHTIAHFHQFPLWDPYKCGGMPMLGDPQSTLLTPFFPLVFLLGAVTALHLSVIVHLAIGFGGAYCLARVFGISELGAIACAGAFGGSSWFYLRAEIGHLGFISFVYAPWAIGWFFLGLERRRLTPLALGGLAMALMLTESGLYQVLFTAVILSVLAAITAIQRRSFKPILLLAVAGAFAFGFGAIKLIPGLAFSGLYPRLQPAAEAMPVRLLLAELFTRNQSPMRMLPPSLSRFWELGAYLGIIFAGLALAGMVLRFRRALPWAIVAAAAFSMAAGEFGAYSPWVLLHHLPIFASTRQPPRWLAVFILAAGMLAGLGTDALRAAAKPWGARLAAALIVLALIDSWSVNARHMYFIVEQPQRPLPSSAVFRQAAGRDYYYRMYMAAKANLGALSCYENIPPETGPKLRGFDQAGYRGEQYLLGPGTVKLTRWTPNALSFDVAAPCPTVMAINQNYYRNWRITEGKGEVVSEDGLLAVVLPPGEQRIEIAYRSEAFSIGLLITLTTFLILVSVWLYERSRAGILDHWNSGRLPASGSE